MSTPADRVAEYLRQRKRQSKDLGNTVHNVWSDPDAEMASLTISDLQAVLTALQVLGTRPEPPRRIDIAQETYADGSRTILTFINEALCVNNTVSVYLFENRKG